MMAGEHGLAPGSAKIMMRPSGKQGKFDGDGKRKGKEDDDAGRDHPGGR